MPKHFSIALSAVVIVVAVFVGYRLIHATDPTNPPDAQSFDEPSVSSAGSPEAAEAEGTISERADAEPAPLVEVTEPATSQPLAVIEKVRRGDTLGKILARVEVPPTQAASLIEVMRKHWDPKALLPGMEISLLLDPEAEDPSERLRGLSLRAAPDRDITVERRGSTFVAAVHNRVLTSVETVLAGVVTTSLYKAAEAAGAPPSVLHQLFGLFAYDVDFQRDLQPGDKFDLVYDSVLDPDGLLVRAGPIKAASLTLSGNVLRLYRYQFSDGSAEWFTPKGDSVKKTLLRTPIDGARLTSGFGRRTHPILGYTSQHMGVDFGAPTGSPIMAAGDGVVERADWFGGYGNYVRIKHNSEISTAYGHMVRFAAGIRPGARVRQSQIIGYVGSTGMSTGPHLHFEVHVGGRPVNPQTVKTMPGRRLDPHDLTRFRSIILDLDKRRERAINDPVFNAKAP
jgi:murein DD-endopeptidase MepM/ murein hydrolase activator NlpD